MKNPIPQRVELEICDSVDRIPGAYHVMPLKQLMQHDSVEKAPEPNSKQQARR